MYVYDNTFVCSYVLYVSIRTNTWTLHLEDMAKHMHACACKTGLICTYNLVTFNRSNLLACG